MKYITNEQEALEAVKQNGLALWYVKEKTKEICLEAVKQNGYALRYVKEQAKEICLEAAGQIKYRVGGDMHNGVGKLFSENLY